MTAITSPSSQATPLVRLLRFLLVGGSSYVVYAGTYALLTRLLFTHTEKSWLNCCANLAGGLYSYLLHRVYTFESKGSHAEHAPRYVLVMVTAMGIQAALFWIGLHLLHLGAHDFVLGFVIAALMACYTFVLHRLFTFRSK